MTIALVAVVVGYMLGSLTFCQIFARLRGKDLGNNLGASSYLSKTHDGFGTVLCTALDVAKGALAYYFFGPAGAVAAVVGHMWSVFFRFRGGRGGATTAGIFLIADPRFLVLYLAYTIARLPFVKSRTARERLDQIVRAILLFILPFTGYEHWLMLEGIVAAITLKYYQVGT